MKIHLADKLSLPLEAVIQKFAFLARSGAGKTYAAGVLVEELLRAKRQAVIVDPIGVWWGLRLAANGKSAGLSIPVLGGDHGDIPLEPTAGELIAKLVAEQGVSAVLDVSEFTAADQRRFVTAFATALHHLKKRNRSPVMVVWEECQDFVPQKVMGEAARMVGAMERLIKQGRNFGVGTTLISQRPQAVNKDVLNQTEILIALQTNGLQERKAIEAWVAEKGAERTLLEKLPSLQIGEAFVWSPQWLKLFARVHIAQKRTYDSSATPVFGKAAPARELAPVDLEALRKEMAATIERASAEDPAKLRQRIAALEAELRKRQAVPVKTERVSVPALSAAELRVLEKVGTLLQGHLGAFISSVQKAQDAQAKAPRMLRDSPELPLVTGPAKPGLIRAKLEALREPGIATLHNARSIEANGAAGALPLGERLTLEALIQYPQGLRRTQLRVLTGYKRSSSDAYLARLRARGYVSDGELLTATDFGVGALPDAKPLPTGEALQQHWLARLPEGERAILQLLLNAYPNPIPRVALDESTGYKRSSRDAYLSRLASKELVVDTGVGLVRASAALFDGGIE